MISHHALAQRNGTPPREGRSASTPLRFARRRATVSLTLLLATLLALLAPRFAAAASDGFLADCRALTRDPHRLVGTEEGRRASEYIIRRLEEIGADLVVAQTFPTAQTNPRKCEVEVTDSATGRTAKLQLEPVRANGIVAPVTLPEGLTGHLLYLGEGTLEDYDRYPLEAGLPIKGAIVVLDYNAGGLGWMRAFRQGAAGVIFVRTDEPEAWQPHFVQANMNIPRFYYDGPRSDLPNGARATIRSEVLWETVEGRNVVAFFDAARLGTATLRDTASLIDRLARQTDSVSQYLYGKLSPELQSRLQSVDAPQAPSQRSELVADLIIEINAILSTDWIYSEERFAGVTLSPWTKDAFEPFDLTAEDFTDLNGFIADLASATTPHTRQLRGRLGGQVAAALESGQTGGEDFRGRFLAGLNEALHNQIFDHEVFAALAVRPSLIVALDRMEPGPRLFLVNRKILAEAFPARLSQASFAPQPVVDRELLVLNRRLFNDAFPYETHQLVQNDVRNGEEFVLRLRDGANDYVKALFGALPAAVQSRLQGYEEEDSEGPDADLVLSLTTALNDVLQTGDLYSRAGSQGVRLPTDLVDLIGGAPADPPAGLRYALNRLVFDAAFPDAITPVAKPGDESVFQQEKGEAIILAADLDSYGEVPRLSPGARGAANCAGLLQLAEFYRVHRPRRHILLAFIDGKARGHAGSSAFYRALETREKKARVETLWESLEDEKLFLLEMRDLLARDNPLAEEEQSVRRSLSPVVKLGLGVMIAALLIFFGYFWVTRPRGADEEEEENEQVAGPHLRGSSPRLQRTSRAITSLISMLVLAVIFLLYTLAAGRVTVSQSSLRRELITRLKAKGEEQTDAIKRDLYNLRVRRGDLRDLSAERRKAGADIPAGPDKLLLTASEREELNEITRQVDEVLNPLKDEWNVVRRAVGRDRVASLAADLTAASKALEADPRRESALSEEVRRLEILNEKVPQLLEEVRDDVHLRIAELDGEERALRSAWRVRDVVGDLWINLHAVLMLGDATPQWGLVIGTDSTLRSPNDVPGLYSKIQSTFLSAVRRLDQVAPAEPDRYGPKPGNFERASADLLLDPTRLLLPTSFLTHSGEIAGLMSIFNLALGTSQEIMPYEGTPGDTLERLDLDRVENQVREIGTLVAAVGDEEGLSLKRSIVLNRIYVLPEFRDTKPYGPVVMGKLPSSSQPNKPMAGATVQLFMLRDEYATIPYKTTKAIAFDDFQTLRTNQNGSYGYGPLIANLPAHWGFATTTDERGVINYASDKTSRNVVESRLNAFECRPGGSGLVLPSQMKPRTLVTVMRARANAPLDPSKSFTSTYDGVVNWFCEDKIRGIKVFGIDSIVGLVNGPSELEAPQADVGPGDMQASVAETRAEREAQEEAQERESTGDGFSLEGAWDPVNTAMRSSSDLWRVNEARMAKLRRREIVNSSMEEIHGQNQNLMMEAARSDSELRRESLASSAFMAERRVYHSTRTMLDDLVHAVLVLLALSVPFAFALERLLIGATNIYRQVAWFAGFFTATFLLLFFSHPAFAIAKTPIIIFLGFTVVVLSGMVIIIIMRKFEVELKVLQGMTTTVHAADVSRFSTIMAAMAMGISTMRRRPMRTALTATTIILLTFTILCFASFGTQTGVIRLFSAPSPDYSGVFLHQVNWSAFDPNMIDLIRGRWGEEAAVCPRYWISPRQDRNDGPLISRADGTEPLALRGLLGIDDREFQFRNRMREVLLGSHENLDLSNSVLVTRAVAEHIGVKPGDQALVGGQILTVGPLVEGRELSSLTDMDGASVIPVDFSEMTSAQQQQQATPEGEMALVETQNWAVLPADSIAIVSAERAQRIRAELHALTIYTDDSQQATSIAEDAARMLPIPAAATRNDGVYRHVLGPVVQASGAKDLLFPIVLGGLVIFATMLGSVEDREREIYTFSALGLAPPHVASLFFAEAMVYSVIGGLSGYLIAQGSMKILAFLAGYGLVQLPEINYSSTNAIVTILLVMLTVMLSAVYPAMKASRSANPGILRSWRLPQPSGDVFDLTFPFTVSEYDITGVVSFLKEHFDNFQDTGLGTFMARDTRLVREDGNMLGLNANLALAPFDLGVTQNFELRSTASEIAGVDEVRIRLERLSGQPKDWQRLNKVLLDDLRKQFLIWRSLSAEMMETYRHRTLTALGQGSGGGLEAADRASATSTAAGDGEGEDD